MLFGGPGAAMPGVYTSCPRKVPGHENRHSYLHINILAVVRLVADCACDAGIATHETRCG